MADQIYLFEGTNTSTVLLELALDTDNLQLLVPGTEMGIPEHDNLYHQSPWAHGEKLARFRLTNRKWPIKLLVGDKDSATPADDLSDALNAFGLLMEQARRYELFGDVNSIGLCIKLDGASLATYYTVKDAETSGASLLDEISRTRCDAQVSFTLITEPLGYGDEETLCNELGTPHFEEDGNGDELADQWNKSGTPTTTLDTSIFLCGSRSQKVVTDTSGTDGIYSDTIDCSGNQSDNFVAYAWVYRSAGDQITLDIVGNVSGSLGTHTYSAATVTDTDSGGRTWKRLTVTGTVGASDTTLTTRIERLTGGATQATTYYVDKCYLQLDEDTVPTVWMSCKNIKNYFESITKGVIPYIDIDDVPGSIDAKTTWKLTGQASTYLSRLFMGRRSGKVPIYWCEFDAYTTGMSYRTNDGVSTPVTVDGLKTVALYTSADTEFLERNLPGFYLLLASVGKTDGVSGTFLFRGLFAAAQDIPSLYWDVTNDWVSGTLSASTETWHLLTLGIIGASTDYMDVPYIATDANTQIKLQALPNPSTSNVGCDFFCLMPADECFIIVNVGAYTILQDTDSFVLTTDTPKHNMVYFLDGGTRLDNTAMGSVLGTIPTLCPSKFQRFIIMSDASAIHHISYGNLTVQIKYRPQTEFLF